MLNGILQEGDHIGLYGLAELVPRGEAYAPGLGKGDAFRGCGQGTKRKEPAGLGKDLPLQSAAVGLGGSEVVLCVLLELRHTLLVRLRHGLHIEGNSGVHCSHVHILGIRQPATPDWFLGAEHGTVKELHGCVRIRNVESAVTELGKAFQHHRSDHGTGMHALEPGVAAVGVAAGKDLGKKVILCGRRFPIGVGNDGEGTGDKPDIPSFGEGEDVAAGGFNVVRDGVLDHIKDGDFLKIGLGTVYVHEHVAEAGKELLPVGTGQEHGAVGLSEGLRRGVDGNLDAHGVGEVSGLERRC